LPGEWDAALGSGFLEILRNCALPIKRVGALAEGGDHFGGGFAEQAADQLFQQARAEGEIEEKINLRAAGGQRGEAPVIHQMVERSLDHGDIDGGGGVSFSRWLQGHARGVALA